MNCGFCGAPGACVTIAPGPPICRYCWQLQDSFRPDILRHRIQKALKAGDKQEADTLTRIAMFLTRTKNQ